MIHCAKISVLEYFSQAFKVKIPPLVYKEAVIKGKEKKYPDAILIDQIIKKSLIQIEKCDPKLLLKYEPFGLRGGELEAVTLYFQLKAKFITSNDDYIGCLRILLNLNLILSPEIIVCLYQQGIISSIKAEEALVNLKKVGWFHPSVIDVARQEVKKDK